jgi:hypothetical protein
LDTKRAYSCLQRKAMTADLAVPIFTKNVKVGQPPPHRSRELCNLRNWPTVLGWRTAPSGWSAADRDGHLYLDRNSVTWDLVTAHLSRHHSPYFL